MKLKLIFALAFAALFGAANAQVSGMEIGYCDGQMKSSGSDQFSTMDDDTDVSAAIFLPAETLEMYKGCSIEQVHAALASTLNVESLTVWIRSALDGENIAQGTITKSTTPKMAKGWNTVSLDAPYKIPENPSAVYVGLTFHQKSVSVGLSVVEPSVKEPVDGGLHVQLGTNAEWKDRSDEGTLAIEALVFGDQLPKFNLALKRLEVQPTFVKDKGTLSGVATVRNLASHTISAFDLECRIGDSENRYTVHFDTPLAYKDEVPFEFTITPDLADMTGNPMTITAEVKNLAEGDEQYPADNSLSTQFEVVKSDFTRNILIEEFTTEKCVNCPRAANILHTVLEMDAYKDRLVALCHHTGYYTDSYTLREDVAYEWFFGGYGTYAPGMMVDRLHTDYTAITNEGSPVFCPSLASDLTKMLDKRIKDVAFVSLKIETTLEDQVAKVKVTGSRSKENFTDYAPRIVVALTEDNIRTTSQAGASGEYFHQHVNRVYNSTWGDVIEWNGDDYTYECELKVSLTKYAKENLGVTAYIWNYDPTDYQKCEVANAAAIFFPDFDDQTTGINGIVADENAPTEYFTLQGVKIAKPESGTMCIAVKAGKATKLIAK